MADNVISGETDATKKENRKQRREREAKVLLILLAAVFGFIAGYAYGRIDGVFDGYQLCLQQFEIIKIAPKVMFI